MTNTPPEALDPALAPAPLAGHDRRVNLRLRLDITHNLGPVERRLRLRGATLLCGALVAMPAILSLYLVVRYAVDVPFWDEWAVAGLLRRIDAGTLTVSSLFHQHNEHRLFVPRILHLAAAMAMGWDTRVMMWGIQLVLIAMLAGCALLWRQSLEGREPWALATLATVSLLLFTPAQHQNWLWGFQICFYLPPACILAGTIVASSRKRPLGWALTITAILSTAAAFSIFPGLLAWPTLAGALIVAHGFPTRHTAWKWGLWLASCAVVIGLYFFGYETPPNSPSPWSTLARPFTLLAGFAASVGAPLAFGQHPVRSAIIAGGAAVGTFAWLLWCIWRRRADGELVLRAAPWIAMSIFGLLAASAIAVGRVGYSYLALLEPRYAALTIWVFVGLVMLSAILRERSRAVLARRVWAAVCTSILLLYAVSFPHHLAGLHHTYRERLQSLAVYNFAEAASAGWPMVPPWVDWPAVRESLFQVERGGWRSLRPEAPVWMNTGSPPNCDYGAVDALLMVEPRVMAAGWVFLPAAGRAADAVLLTAGPSRRIVVLQPPLGGRGDIGARFNTDDALVSGWVIDARPTIAGEELEFWALDAKAMRAYRLCRQQ